MSAARAEPSPGPGPVADGDLVVRYRAEVVRVGPLVEDFRAQGVLVFFGEQAPEELHDFCVLTRADVADGGPEVGGVVRLDDVDLPVTAVGHVAVENLLRLGHLDLKADGATVAPLPGDVCVPRQDLPGLAPGSTITVLSRPRPARPAGATTTRGPA